MRLVIGQLVNELLEHAATMFVIFELIEAGARRRSQRTMSPAGRLVMRFRRRDELSPRVRWLRFLNLLFNFVCRGADEAAQVSPFVKQG